MSPAKVYVRSGIDRKTASQLPKLSLDQWRKIASTKPRIVTDTAVAATLASHRKAAEANIKTLTQVYASAPIALARLGIKDGSARPALVNPSVSFAGNDLKPHAVQTLSRDGMVHDALVARALLNSRINKAQVYASVLRILQVHAKTNQALSDQIKALPQKLELTTNTIKDIDALVKSLIDIAEKFRVWNCDSPSVPPLGYPASCGLEEGTGNGGDTTWCNAATPRNPFGLLESNNWPLKFFTTCIRNQFNRGACPAFAITAAMECSIAATYGRWVNLSEQDLYKHQKHDWFPLDDYDEGFSPIFSMLLQMLSGYTFPWERDWDYNPSRNRLDDKTHRTYSHSCDNYVNRNCSDTNHQSHRTCYQIDQEIQREITHTISTWVEDAVTVVDNVVDWFGNQVGQNTHTELWGHWVEQTVTEVVTDIVSTSVCLYDTTIPSASGFGATGASVFWDPLTDGRVGLALAKLKLSHKVPVIYAMFAMPSFKNAQLTGGYVVYKGPNESPGNDEQGNALNLWDLGHVICLTGFVDNANLPLGAPPGSGGGYFIAKNSWGTAFGDAGYAYLPYDWVVTWGQVMCTIDTIT